MAMSVKKVPAPPSAEPTSIERVEAWTVSQAADVLSATSISSPTSPRLARGSSVKLDIPLDESALDDEPAPRRTDAAHTVYKRREPIRRDSLKRREALLKGKEGSRQRRRWENDRLLGNPHAQPPLPEDWEVRPVYKRQTVPYFLAPLWDAEYARLHQKREQRKAAAKAPASKEEETAAKVQRELRDKLKRSRGARGLLQDLEQEVRHFVEQWEQKQKQLEKEGLINPDSEDEEIVFVGRNGTMSDERRRSKELETMERDRLIFESLVADHGASFGYDRTKIGLSSIAWLTTMSRRYLVHAIAQYYDLSSWSVTTGDLPPRRQAYVGLKADPVTRRPSLTRQELPRPLWMVV
jgi:hypothetical protein